MYVHLLCGNREIFVLPSVVVPRAASGRPEAVADDARDEEVTLVDSTCEAGEQSGAVCGGVGGGRRRDQEECGIAKHGPNAESGGRVTLFFYSWFCEGIELQYELEPSQRRGTTFSGLLGSIVDGWAHGWWQRHAGGADGNAGCWPRCRANDEAFPVLLDLGFGERVEVGDDVGPGRGVI